MMHLQHHPECKVPRVVCLCKMVNWSSNKTHVSFCPIDKPLALIREARFRGTNFLDEQSSDDLMWLHLEYRVDFGNNSEDMWYAALISEMRPIIQTIKDLIGWPTHKAFVEVEAAGKFITKMKLLGSG